MIGQAAGLRHRACSSKPLRASAVLQATVGLKVLAGVAQTTRLGLLAHRPCPLGQTIFLNARQCIDLLARVIRQAAGLHTKAAFAWFGSTALVEAAVLVDVHTGLIREVAGRDAHATRSRSFRITPQLGATVRLKILAATARQATCFERLAERCVALKGAAQAHDAVVLRSD